MSVTRQPRGRITRTMVEDETAALQQDWASSTSDSDQTLVRGILGSATRDIDPFDLVQLANVIRTCQRTPNLSAAGRALFSVSREKRSTQNDADRLRKYLQKFNLDWHKLTVPSQ